MRPHPKFQVVGDTVCMNFGSYGSSVEVAAFSGDAERLLTVHEVGVAKIWDTVSGAEVAQISPSSPLTGKEGLTPFTGGFRVFIESAALNRDGSLALLGLNDGTAGVFRVADGQRLAVLHPPAEEPATRWSVLRAVAFSPDGVLALVGFPGRHVGVWSADGRRCIAFLSANVGSKLVSTPSVRDTLVSSIAASQDGRWVFAGSADGTASIWELAQGRVVFEAVEHAEQTLTVFDVAAGFGWATAGGSVWCVSDGSNPIKAFDTHELWGDVAFRAEAWLTRGLDGTVVLRTWNGETTELAAGDPSTHIGWPHDAPSIGFGTDGSFFFGDVTGKQAVAVVDGRRVAVKREAAPYRPPFALAALSPRRDFIALAGWGNEVALHSLADGSLLRSFASPGGVGALAFAPDGRFIAIGEIGHGGGHYERHVFIYEVGTGDRIRELALHDWQVSGVAFSSDGRWLATKGRHVVLTDLNAGFLRSRHTLQIAASHVGGMQFTSRGELVIVDEGKVHVASDGRLRCSFEAPIQFGSRWCVSGDGSVLTVGIPHGVMRFDLGSGKALGVWKAAIPSPEVIPSGALVSQAHFRLGVDLWRTEHGCFLHQGDGPRGWVEPLSLSESGELAIPVEGGAAVVRILPEPAILAVVPFEGRMRASRVTDEEIVLANDDGRIFRSQKPGLPSASA
jgi:WD40 repeat protein